MRHLARARTEHVPSQKRTYHRIGDADPKRGKAVLPAELPRVADEHHRAEVAGTETEGGKPGANVSSAQNEAIHALGAGARPHAHADNHADEYQDNGNFRNHA